MMMKRILSTGNTSLFSNTFNNGLKNINASAMRMSSTNSWAKVVKGPEDPILGVTVAYNKDPVADKINLGVGAYRDDNNKPFVLDCVKKAEKKLQDSNPDHEYAPIVGVAAFNKVAQELILGKDSEVIKSKRATTVQALSGTGALRVAGDFMARHLDVPLGPNGKKLLYVSSPTWGNHNVIFKDSGFEVRDHKYYDPKTCGLDFEGFKNDIKNAPNKSVFLLHTCAHNPTGVDPSQAQWKELSQLFKEKEHFVFFDTAYQGFASGDAERDAFPVRQFIADGHNVGIAQSFAKNFGLYGERIGALTFVCKDAEEVDRLESQLKILIRPMYSNPPVYGARVVANILQDPALTSLWKTEVKLMADRIIGMREQLVAELKNLGSKKDWSHVTNQIGMFCFTGLTPEQVDKATKEHHVYFTRNGRISIAGLTTKNVKQLAKAMHEVTK